MTASNTFLQRLELLHPIVQAPMAGVSTPAMATAVSNAGGLGSISIGVNDMGGLPGRESISAWRAAGIFTMATATSPQEAQFVDEAGVDEQLSTAGGIMDGRDGQQDLVLRAKPDAGARKLPGQPHGLGHVSAFFVEVHEGG